MDSITLITVILLGSMNAFFMIVGIFLNFVVIISLMKSSQLRKNLGYFMILVLSCFDLTVVTFVHPMLLLSIISWSVETHYQYENEFDKWEYIVKYNMAGFSMSTLLTMSVERYLAIKYPFFHHTAVTKRRLILFLTLLVVITVSLSSMKYLDKTIFRNAVLVYILLFLFLFIYLNYTMYIIAKSKRKVESITTTNGQKTSKRRRIINFKNISTCSITMGCFFICALPHIIFSILLFINKLSNERDIHIFRYCEITFFITNSTLNCLIFFWRNSILRREGMKTIKCFWRGRS